MKSGNTGKWKITRKSEKPGNAWKSKNAGKSGNNEKSKNNVKSGKLGNAWTSINI